MIVTRRHLPRRTVLRGMGVTLSLPLFDAMVPAFAAARQTAARPVRRLCAVYAPMGAHMAKWTPTVEAALELSPMLQARAPFKGRVLLVSGLDSRQALSNDSGLHPRAQTTWLTGASPVRTEGIDVRAGISMDQVAADELGKVTQLRSLELA